VRKGFAVAKMMRVEAERAASSAEARLRASRTFQMERRRLRRRRAEVVAPAALLPLPRVRRRGPGARPQWRRRPRVSTGANKPLASCRRVVPRPS
jgi:hypothetical protein